MDHALRFLRENGQPVYRHLGIAVTKVSTEQDGVVLALLLLQQVLDKQTVLYLSGGRTPKQLYAALAQNEQLHPGAFAMVDERYGEPMHENSNEKMLRDTGLFRYFQMRNIPFYPILSGVTRIETADQYDQAVRSLQAQYQKHVAILGIGMDGHTAGIPAISANSELQMANGERLPDWFVDLQERSKNRMVIDYDDQGGFYKERITMTFQGLMMMDLFIVLVFGKDKKMALELLFEDGSEDEIPSRFFKRPEIAARTLLITDQMI